MVKIILQFCLEKAYNSKVKAMQHQNDSMMKELQTLGNEFSRLQESLRSHEAEASKHGGQSQPGPDPEITKALQFVSSENDDLTGFCNVAKKDLAAFKKRFKSLSVQVSEMVGGLDALARYSYSFNVKLLGIPEIDWEGVMSHCWEITEVDPTALGLDGQFLY